MVGCFCAVDNVTKQYILVLVFDKSRGHPIEREAYIRDLRQRPKSG